MAERGKAYLVEVDSDGLRWVKGSSSGANQGSCVECARTGDQVVVRDSKQRGRRLHFSGAQWALFLSSIVRNR